jgi:class 3 adenylate cyclase
MSRSGARQDTRSTLWARPDSTACRATLVFVGPPSGTVTFLFSDIEGSTRLWESSPEGMRFALARHDTIVRQAIEGYGGYVFGTGGDGFAAALSRCRAAGPESHHG